LENRILKNIELIYKVKNMKKEQFDIITKWQDETFKKASALSKISHLKEEIEELVLDLKNNDANKRKEFADCFILLFGAAASDGMSYNDICYEIDEKMKTNYERKWGKPNNEGVVNHIKE
jgi:NTP pyrophosphatase (non-canonical NTP hydrolase)